MKGRLEGITLSLLVVTLLAACGPWVRPTPLSLPSATAAPPTVTTALPTAKAVDIAESSCVFDEDCAYAFRLDRCCDCPAIYSRQYVDAEPRLLLSRERWDYDYPVPRATPADCSGIHCAECPGPGFGPICADQTCRAPETWDEVLRVCPTVADPQSTHNCYIQAATLAYLQVGLDQSLEICDLVTGEVVGGVPGKDYCASMVGRTVLYNDPDRAAAFCLDHLQQSQSRCLKEAGETIALQDVDRGLDICERIVVRTNGDQFQRDACFHNVATQVGETDVTRACEICERMVERVDDCKRSAGQR